jgi:hypothetical protein
MKYEIIHDTIALQVFEKASIEARTRRKVEKYIAERYEAYQQRGAQLDQDDLDYISPYLDQVNISPEESAFIRKGAAALQKAKRRRQALILGVIAILAIFLAVALFQWRSAAASRAEAEASALKADSSAVVANKAKEDALEQARIAKEKEEEAAAQKKNWPMKKQMKPLRPRPVPPPPSELRTRPAVRQKKVFAKPKQNPWEHFPSCCWNKILPSLCGSPKRLTNTPMALPPWYCSKP